MKFFKLFTPIILCGFQIFAANPYRVNYLIEVSNHSSITNNVEFSILIDGQVIEKYKGIPSNNKPYFKKILFIKDKPSYLKLNTEETVIDFTKINYDNHCTLYPFQFTSTNGLKFDIIIDVDDIREFSPKIKDPSFTFCEGTEIILNSPCEFESEYTNILWQYANNSSGPWNTFGSHNRKQPFEVIYNGDFLYFRNILNGVKTKATAPVTVLKRPPKPTIVTVKPPICKTSNDWQIKLTNFEYYSGSGYSSAEDGNLEYTLTKKDTLDKRAITFKSANAEVLINSSLINHTSFISFDTDYLIYIELETKTCLSPPIPVFLPAPPPFEINNISHLPISCQGNKDGLIEIDFKNAKTPVSYNLINSSLQVVAAGGSGNVPLSVPVEATDTYTLSIEDACQDTLIHTGPITIAEPAPFNAGIISANYGNYCDNKPCNVQRHSGKDSISININGGTAPYQVSLNGKNWSLEENKSLQIPGLSAGWHVFKFSDHENLMDPARGCLFTDSIRLLQPNPVSLSLTDSQPPLCKEGEDGSIQLSAIGGIPWSTFNPYQLDVYQDGIHHQSFLLNDTIDFKKSIIGGGFNYHSGHDFKFVVTDKYHSSDSIISYLPFQSDTVALNMLKVTPPKCANGTDGRIYLSAKGGYPYSEGYNFQLLKDENIVASYFKTNNLEFSNLSPGIYEIVISDSICNPAIFEIIVPQPKIQLQLNVLSVTPISCFGKEDGKILVKAINGTPDYSFYLNDAYAKTTDGILEVANLDEGTHRMMVIDQNGCKDSTQATINMPAEISISFPPVNIDPPSCFNNADGYIEPSITGGTGNYSNWHFLWSNNKSFNSNDIILQNVEHGIYHLLVKDINNCQSTANLELVPGPKLNVMSVESIPETCKNRSDGRIIDITTSLDHQNLNYVIDDTLQTKNYLILKLSEGQHNLIVQNEDGCVSTPYQFQIESKNIEVIASVTDSIKCHNNTAMVNLLARNSIGQSNFYLDSILVVGEYVNLPAAQYEIFAIDATGCVSKPINLDISEPAPLTIKSFETEPEYCGLKNGRATVNLEGGSLPYQLKFIDTRSQQPVNPTMLSASSYELHIEDQNGCSQIHYFDISEASSPKIELIATKPEYCSLNIGSAVISVQNGYKPFRLKPNYAEISETEFKVSNLSAGWNLIEISDHMNCSFSDSIYISTLPEMEAQTTDLQDASCGLKNGFFNIEVINGFQPFEISSNHSNYTGFEWYNLPAGIHQVRIEDSLGCIINKKIAISNLSAPEFTIAEVTDSYCDLNTGMARVSSEHTDDNIQVTFLNHELKVIESGSQASNLAAGDYYVKVSDNNGCFSYQSFTVEKIESPDLAIDLIKSPQCNASDGELIGNFSSQFEPVSYGWFLEDKKIANSKQLENISSGKYLFSATDGLGCSKSAFLKLEEKERPTVEVRVLNRDYCNLQNGSIEVRLNTQHPVVNYYLDHADKGQTSILNDIKAGKHSLYVLDTNFCSSDTINFHIQSEYPERLNFDLIPPSCNGKSDGKIIVQNRADKNSLYKYKLGGTSWQEQNEFSNLVSGSYTLSAIDSVGCMIDTVVHISEPLPIQLITSNLISPTCPDGNDGSASFIFTGGTEPYQYQLNQGPQVNYASFNQLDANSYSLSVVDKNGCSKLYDFKITSVPPLKNSLESQYLICEGQIAVIKPGRHWEAAIWNFPDHTNLETLNLISQEPGLYKYSLMSPNGCVLKDSLEIILSDQLLEANMLVTSHALVGDSVVIIDITKPEPDQSDWEFGKAEVEIISQNTQSTVVIFQQAGEYNIYLTSQLAECIDHAEQKILISELYDDQVLEDFKSSCFKNLIISPNPSHGICTLEIELRETQPVELEITEIKSGAAIFRKKLDGRNLYYQTIDLQGIAPGLYLVQCKCNTEIVKGKLLII